MKRSLLYVRGDGPRRAEASVAVAVVATGATARYSANIQVCVLLPDTKSSVRWVQFDPKYIAGAQEGGRDLLDHERAERPAEDGRAGRFVPGCRREGRHRLDIAQGTSIAIQKKFAKAGGSSIDYDRQVVGGIAKVYVTFDGTAVGAAQANGVLGALKGKSKPVVAELWAARPTRTRSGSRAGTTRC